MLKLAQLLYGGSTVDAHLIRAMFRVSVATSKRDMVKIEQCLPVRCELVKTGAPYPMKRFRLGVE